MKVFIGILRDVSKEDTLEYVLALIDDMLTGLYDLVSDSLFKIHK